MAENDSPETILAQALELSDMEERAAYLDGACGGDRALRVEMESLLAAHFAADEFMGTRVRPVWAEALTVKSDDQGDDSSIPSIEELKSDFPELEIIELIGRGGMGAVIKARQESLDRFVALKVLPSDWNASGSLRERFEREAKTLAALNHPNIVTIHDFGERNGRFYFTMEFVDGTDLARMIQSGEMTPELALPLIPQICEAMQFAHDGGVVHRDIKPANILVGRDGRVKVADFGIAKLGSLTLEGEPGATTTSQPELTAPRGVLGTPRYMAPEQASGSGELDHRADLYALGMVFYEMLVGSTPPKGTLVVPPSRQAKVDRRWDRVVLRALEEDPDRRYQNATEIKTAVESVLAEQKRLVPGWLKAVAVVALGSAAAGAVLMWPKDEAKEEGPLVNSLGMEFVPVSGLDGLVSVWETRVKDYEQFVEATGRLWTGPLFEQSPDHPAVHVSWHDARAFCEWLTDRERKAGKLPEGEVYRLPTDREWSAMAHLTAEEGSDPQERDLGQLTIFPWGEEAPVPEGAGNFPDHTGREQFRSAAVTGYADGFGATAPVGSFRPTPEGLYDLGGNVWEWTASSFSATDAHPVMRGGGWWASEADDGWQSLLASHRRADVEATEPEEWDVGFRVIRGPEPAEEEGSDLFRLVLKGDLEGVGKALAEGGDVNAANRAGQPPIVLAADTRSLEMVKLLHELGAKLTGSDRRGRTALHAAAELGHVELVRWLLEQGADPRARTITGAQPLLLAVSRAPLELLDELLAAGGPETLTSADSHGVNPLTRACLSGQDEAVRWNLEQLSADQIREATALWISTAATLLAERDSSVMTLFLAKATDRLTPEALGQGIVAAVNYDNEANFSLLLEAAGEDGLDQQTIEGAGVTATGGGRPWAIKALLGKGWDLVEYEKLDGNSLLHLAVIDGGKTRGTIRSFALKRTEAETEKWSRRVFDRMFAQIPPPATRETIRVLAEAGADLEARDGAERTPLVAAAFRGNIEAVETLLELGADVEAKDDAGFTSLLCAVEDGHLEIVKELDRRGADFGAVTGGQRGVLHVVHRHDEVLRYLLGKDLPLEAKDKNGATPLVAHAADGDEGVISLLLEAGAEVGATATAGEWAGDTPLHWACRVIGEEARAEQLQKAETRVRLGGPNIGGAAPSADKEERVRAIKLLLEAGADPEARNATSVTPLHLAAESGLSEVVEIFLERGGNPNALTATLLSPIHFAAQGGQLETARILLEKKAWSDSPAWQTPVAVSAVHGGNREVLELLLEHKAPLDRQDFFRGATPLHQAAYAGQRELVEVMLDHGADVDATDYSFRTALHVAASGNHREVVELLWRRGARMEPADKFSATPLQVARSAGHIALAVEIEKWARKPFPRPAPAESVQQPSE